MLFSLSMCFFFFFNATPTTEIYTLSLHDALPIFEDEDGSSLRAELAQPGQVTRAWRDHPDIAEHRLDDHRRDRKSTLNSSHANISYAVFCLKKKKKKEKPSKRSRKTITQDNTRTS